MIFVTLGTQDKEFTRLLKAIEKEVKKGNIKEEIVIQAGFTKYNSKNMRIFDLVSPEEFDKYMKDATLIITHGGVGSIITALKYKKPIIATPRLSKYKEHNNDHQIEIIKEFSEKGYIIPLYDFSKLNKALEEAQTFIPNKYKSNNNKLKKYIKEYIDNSNHISWYNKYRILIFIILIILIILILV